MVFRRLPIDQKRLHPRAVIPAERQIIGADRRIGKRAFDLGRVGLEPEPGLHLRAAKAGGGGKHGPVEAESSVMLGKAHHQPVAAGEPPGMAQRCRGLDRDGS
jgi:hypothetical protein